MKKVLEKAFKNKTVLVTGHTGFKGSWLSLWLATLGAEVIGFAQDPYTRKDNFVLNSLSEDVVDLRGDIRDFDRLQEVFDYYKPEIVFHLAAQPLVRESYAKPKLTLDVNIGGTVNLLEVCRLSSSVKVIVNITSDKCYENREWLWGYRENDPMGGHDPYSASKGCSELISNAFRNSFFPPDHYKQHGKSLATVRAGNVIGGGDWSMDRLIPDCVRSLENHEEIIIRNPLATRPWQFVLEPLGGYLLLAARMWKKPKEFAGAWNFGPERDAVIPVGDLVDLLIRYWGSGSWKIAGGHSALHEANFLALDINKARYKLDWRPRLEVKEAVEQTVRWYRGYSQVHSLKEFCRSQINEYMNRMEQK